MKNNIAFKFVAVVLCAACLMTAVGSGVGIFIMTESGLYEKTVDEAYREQLELQGSSMAQQIAYEYACTNLGGCPENMDIHRNYSYFNFGYYSYVLKDADGNALASQDYAGMDTANAVTLEIPVTGEYMHVLSITPESEKYPQVESEETWLDGETYIYDAIPYDGAQVYRISISYPEGSEGMGSDEPIGQLTYTEYGDSSIRFQAYHSWYPDIEDGTVLTGISFYGEEEELLYEIHSPDTVGILYQDADGCAVFESIQSTVRYDVAEATAATEVTEVTGSEGVITQRVPLRSTPGLDGEIIGYLSEDEEVLITEETVVDGCVWGFAGGELLTLDRHGWVKMDYVDLIAAETETIPAETEAEDVTWAVVNQTLNLRLSPNPNGTVTGVLKEGDEVAIAYWATVDGAEWGKTEGGWIQMEYVTILSGAAPAVADVADRAEQSLYIAEEAMEIYSMPSTGSAIVESLEPYVQFEVTRLETVNDQKWGYISSGWVLMEHALPVDAAVPAAEETAAYEETIVSTEPTLAVETVPETVPVETVELVITDYGVYTTEYYDTDAEETMYVEYTYAAMPMYTVELVLAPGVLDFASYYTVLELVWAYRNELFVVLGFSVLLFAVLAVYLCCAAGKKPGSTEVRAAGLNCIPLDAYLAAAVIGISCLLVVLVEGGDYLIRQNVFVGCVFMVGMAYLACLLFVGFCFAFAAQVKTPGGYWCSNTLICRCLSGVIGAGKWGVGFCADKLFPASRKGFGWLCHATVKVLLFGKRVVIALFEIAKTFWRWFWALVKKWTAKLWKAMNRFLTMLPLTWQWVLVGFVLVLWLFIAVDSRSEGMLMVWLCAAIAMVLYGAHCFGNLMESTRRMSKGDLDTKVDDRLMVGCFQEFAGDLNDLAGVAVVAAQKQLKSERMKTELITNVSHDIKTPLTSIINYVDLLQKPHTDKEQEQYLEVLDRQSQRLKKLIDDLMEMSKANTGNLAVDITRLDAEESINQALGEFSDKLEKAQLTPVFRRPEEPVAMMADGRLVWRVLSNLLSNAVKYALPGTRLYIDLMELEGKVIISLKNISREELNVDADELMERFVRGDDSRNTEGSGLGLNIAKSLMELQKGQLQLLVDGDLFKVTLIFPGA